MRLLCFTLIFVGCVQADIRLRMGAAFTRGEIESEFGPDEQGVEAVYQVALLLEKNLMFLRPRITGEIGRFNQRPVYSANGSLHAFATVPIWDLEPAIGAGFAHTGYNRLRYRDGDLTPERKFIRIHSPFYSLSLRFANRLFGEFEGLFDPPLHWKFRLGVVFPEN